VDTRSASAHLQRELDLPPGSFKSDDSFIQKLATGAVATRRTFERLAAEGHDLVELERGSLSFKLWRKNIKRKRIRVPDLMCRRCGKRFESRGKTRVQISMSHSPTDGARAWNAGLAAGDVVTLVRVVPAERPADFAADDLVQFINVNDLARTADQAKLTAPKGATEGSEVQICWPARVADEAGRVEEITDTAIRYRTHAGRRRTVQLTRRGAGPLIPMVAVGEEFPIGRILASVAVVTTHCACAGGATNETFLGTLTSLNLADRYASAKALRHVNAAPITDRLLDRMRDEREDIYVRLEAAASLLIHGNEEAREFFATVLEGEHDSFRLEAVIVLAEVKTSESTELLRWILGNADVHPDIRGAAAWSIGEIGLDSANVAALIGAFQVLDSEIRREAGRALSKLARNFRAEVVTAFPAGDHESQRPGIAWALARAGVTVDELLGTLTAEDNVRHWIAYMIGTQDRATMLAGMEALRARDPEVYFAVNVLWTILESWIKGFDE